MSGLPKVPLIGDLAYSGWHAEIRPVFTTEVRRFNAIDMIGVRQPAGAFPDPAGDFWLLQIITAAHARVHFDFGAGRIADTLLAGHIALSTAGTECDYDLDSEHELVAISLPARSTAELLREINPGFSGQFGQLHSILWRDNEIRDFALKVWRAGKGDARAPSLDPDEALLRLSVMLMRRADRRFSPKELAWGLAPHARRRVMEYIEAHLDEELPLFRLAAVAGYSPFHFARAFRSEIGDTPHRYVTRRRLAKAQELLKATKLTLAEIALTAGFSSQSRLNDVFAREIGATPGMIKRAAIL
jgi:AraC family transcriptional regulator